MSTATFGPPLIIWLGPHRYAFPPGRDVTVGLDRGADIRLDGVGGSARQPQVVLHFNGSQWIAVDRSEAGIYVDGVRMSTVFIHEGRAITLGDPQHGPRLVFQLAAPPAAAPHAPRVPPPMRPHAPPPPPPPRPVPHSTAAALHPRHRRAALPWHPPPPRRPAPQPPVAPPPPPPAACHRHRRPAQPAAPPPTVAGSARSRRPTPRRAHRPARPSGADSPARCRS